MRRVFYVAGISSTSRAKGADSCPYWLITCAEICRRNGEMSGFLEPYIKRKQVLFDPGTFMKDPIAYRVYRLFLEQYAEPGHLYLQYDEVGDPDATAWYLTDMRRKGYDPVPVLTPGGSAKLLDEPIVAIGGLVPMRRSERIEYLDDLFYPQGEAKVVGHVHLLGVTNSFYFRRYPATTGDSSSWLPREPSRPRTMEDWMRSYGEQVIPLEGPESLQGRFAL